jgi:WD40 repeat protein
VALSPDGRLLATGSGDAIIRFWDRETGQFVHELRGHRGGPSSLSFSPDGRTLVSGSDDTTVLCWDMTKVVKRFPVPISGDR